MDIELLGELRDVEVIARGSGIRELDRLRRVHGPGNWRKLKGIAEVRLQAGDICVAEVHWYEAHGIGKREFKLKRILGSP